MSNTVTIKENDIVLKIDTFAAGLADPTTLTGDLLYRDGLNVLTRLPIGTAGQVLKVAGGVPVWGTDVSVGEMDSFTPSGGTKTIVGDLRIQSTIASIGGLSGVTLDDAFIAFNTPVVSFKEGSAEWLRISGTDAAGATIEGLGASGAIEFDSGGGAQLLLDGAGGTAINGPGAFAASAGTTVEILATTGDTTLRNTYGSVVMQLEGTGAPLADRGLTFYEYDNSQNWGSILHDTPLFGSATGTLKIATVEAFDGAASNVILTLKGAGTGGVNIVGPQTSFKEGSDEWLRISGTDAGGAVIQGYGTDGDVEVYSKDQNSGLILSATTAEIYSPTASISVGGSIALFGVNGGAGMAAGLLDFEWRFETLNLALVDTTAIGTVELDFTASAASIRTRSANTSVNSVGIANFGNTASVIVEEDFGQRKVFVNADTAVEFKSPVTSFKEGAAEWLRISGTDAAGATITGLGAVGDLDIITPGGTKIDGSADVVQLTVQAHSTQTTLPFVVETSAGTDVFTVSNAGAVVASSTVTGTAFYLNDTNVGIVESGTNDLDVKADNAVVATFSGTGLSLAGTAGLTLSTAGQGLLVKEGSDATMGVATLVGGTIVVSTTKVTANSRIFLSVQDLGTVAVATPVAVTARTASTSFTITSLTGTDTSVIAWMIVEPA